MISEDQYHISQCEQYLQVMFVTVTITSMPKVYQEIVFEM